MTTRTYFVNGEFVAADAAMLPVTDLGFLRGYGVFDLLRTYDGAPFRLDAHLARLERSAQAIGLAMPWTRGELTELALETYARNALPNASIRLVVTGNVSDNFMMPHREPTLAILVDPLSTYGPEVYAAGGVAVTTRIPRVMAQVKSTNYIGAIMAMQEAKPYAAVEAIYRTEDDRLSEGTRANFFVVGDGVVYTPGEEILLGVTRQAVIDAAQGAVEIIEREVTMDDVRTADEVFLTSTTKELLPIRQIDDLVIGTGKPGPITARLTTLFHELVAQEIRDAVVVSQAARV